MSEDEDEELAMLRLQALMSKRRAGSATSKVLPFPVSLTVPAEPAAPVLTESPMVTPAVVVTSAPAALPDPVEGINNGAVTYRQPRFVHGQASYPVPLTQQPGRGHPRFPAGRGAFQRGPRPSGNLIVIQTVPMEGDPEPTQHLPTAGLPGPRAPPSDGPTALLRPQDKWTAQKTTKPKPAVTKFSRYNESSDSDECDTSDSDSSSSDDTDDVDAQPASGKDDSPPRDVAEVDVCVSPADSRDSVNDASADISERSPTHHATDSVTAAISTEQTDLPTEDGKDRRSSASNKSRSSSSSSGGTPPSPIRSPLQFGSRASSSLLPGAEFRRDPAAFRLREHRNTRRSPPRRYGRSSPYHLDAVSGRSPLRTSDGSQSRLAKNSSASDLQPLSRLASDKSLSYSRSVASDKMLRPRSPEGRPSLVGRYVSRSRSSERRPQTPPRSQYDESTDRGTHSRAAEHPSRSQSPSVGRSPERATLRASSARQRKSQSKEKDVRRPSRSHSSSRSCRRSSRQSRSRSGERFASSPKLQSLSRSRSRSPVRSSRSGSVDRRPNLPASRDDKHIAGHLDSEVGLQRLPTARYPPTDSYKDATRRTLSTRYARDVSAQLTAEDRRLSPCGSSSRSPRGSDREPGRTDTKSLPRQARVGSKSRSSSRQRSPSRRSSERLSPSKGISPTRHDRKKQSERYASGHSAGKPQESISRKLPEVRDRLSPLPSRLRKRSSSSDRYLATRRRSPDASPAVYNLPVSQRQGVRGRLGASSQRSNEAIRSHLRKRYSPSPPDSAAAETKTRLPYKSRAPDRRRLGRQVPNLPVTSKPAKSEVPYPEKDETRPLAQSRYRPNLADSPSMHPEIQAGKSEGSSVVKRPKKLSEPDKVVPEQMTEFGVGSTSSARGKRSDLQEAKGARTNDDSASTEPAKTSTHKALTSKRPAAAGAAALEARKRRFEQTQDADSRSVCIRSSSDAAPERHAKLPRQLSPVLAEKPKRVGKEPAGVVRKSEESGKEKASGKSRMDISDISDLTSANSSMSLEDISEDEASQVQDRRSDIRLTQRRPERALEPTKGGAKSRGRDSTSDSEEDATDMKTSAVSSIVKSVKKDTEWPEAHAVESGTRRTQPAQLAPDDSPESEDGIVVDAVVRNVVSKELSSGPDIQQKLRLSVHSRLGSVATASEGSVTSARKLTDNQRGNVAAAKPTKPGDLRERLRGVEPASQEMSRQADTSQSGWGFPSRCNRRRRR